MKLKKRARREAEVDMSAFSDLAFLLIIFFILTTTLEQFTGTVMDVPAGVEKEEQQEKKQLTVNVAVDAVYYGEDGTRMTLDEFRDALRAENLAEKDPNDRVVLVDVREDVPYDQYYKVVTEIANSGGVMGLIKRAKKGGGS